MQRASRFQIHPRVSRAWRPRLLLAAAFIAWAFGCGKKEPEKPKPPVGVLPNGEILRVRHITIQYAGARGAPTSVKRSRASADSLAKSLVTRLEKGELFADLARQYSDDASATDGGDIEPLQPGDVPPEFERAAMALKPGERAPLVESPYGFHIIERRSEEKLAAQQILVCYAGAKDCPDSIVRGRAEALALAQKILGEVRHPDSSFPVAASIYSEDPRSNTRGGYVGQFVRGNMDPQFEAAVAALKEGEISTVVETRYGFHILRRVKPMTIRVAQILITHSGSQHMDQPSNRTREEALQRAADVLFRAQKGEDFAALAREYSEDPITKDRGGRMWNIDHGETVPRFEDAAFSLQPNQISAIVETEFGFHIIKRLY